MSVNLGAKPTFVVDSPSPNPELSSYYPPPALRVEHDVAPATAHAAATRRLLQEREHDIIFYKNHFVNKYHDNLLTHPSAPGPVALSIVLDGKTYRGLLRHSEGSVHLSVDSDIICVSFLRKLLRLGPSLRMVIEEMSKSTPINPDALLPCSVPAIQNDFLDLEAKQIVKTFKFGVTYLSHKQSTEAEMFDNQHESCSAEFDEFLCFIGDKVELCGWANFRAGLDVTKNLTGKYSVYRKWNDYEIMFHVSTYLPFNPLDKQQLERKRHIGNDIVLLIFQDSSTPFDVSTLTSKQTQVVILVYPEGSKYRVAVCRKQGVPNFLPLLSDPPLIEKNDAGLNFLIEKLIMAERASYLSPSFLPKLSRTRGDLLLKIAEKYIPQKD